MTEERISLKGAVSMPWHLHHKESEEASAPQMRGFVWNWARRYDHLMGLVALGREQGFRQRIADLDRLQPGEFVLDVGCGIGEGKAPLLP